ncbi:MAG: glutathione S-transferase [Pseudomonadota bacterium]
MGAAVTDLPVLYSFRRCPYAMRGRMALLLGGKSVRLREILLRDKPEQMIEASPKATVPVLILPDGTVIDESLEVMRWALNGHAEGKLLEAGAALIADSDGPFKHHLDRYKYATRYEGVDVEDHRAAGAVFLWRLNERLSLGAHLAGDAPSALDCAIFPFVRQFRIADPGWFDTQNWPALQQWLSFHMQSALFLAVMEKYPLWKETGEEHLLGETVGADT